MPLPAHAPTVNPHAIASASTLLIDLHQHSPDGTMESLTSLTKAISSMLEMEIIVGLVEVQQLLRSGLSSSGQQSSARESAIDCGLREAATATKSCFFASLENHSSLALQSLRQELKAKCVLGFGVANAPVPCGVILVLNESTPKKSGEDLSRIVEQFRRELANWVMIWYYCYSGRSARGWLNRIERLTEYRKHWKLCSLAIIACLFAPVPYWPKRECLTNQPFGAISPVQQTVALRMQQSVLVT